MTAVLAGRVGIGFRRELAAALLHDPARVGFVEVVAETARDPRLRREAHALAAVWPVVPHGVKLSLGSAEGLDPARVSLLAGLARDLRAPAVSEHIAFVRAGSHEVGHLTELPMTRAAVAVVARNVDTLRRALGDTPLLLENVARGFLWPDDAHEMDEGTFLHEIAEATGCPLLLDVGNLYANAVNAGLDPAEALARCPLHRVAMLHVAGGVWEDGFYFDTHGHPVPEAVFALTAAARTHCPTAALLLERDSHLDDPAPVLAELDRLAALPARTTPAPAMQPPRAPQPPDDDPHLAARQRDLAGRLVATTPDAHPAVARAQRMLVGKRADDALPLLPHLGPRIDRDRAMALGALATRPRSARLAAADDALAIARAAAAAPSLAPWALRDLAVLRARFSVRRGVPAPRRGPYLGRSAAAGRTVWGWKGFGYDAPVRLWTP